jgi:hypothetical protein
MFDQGEEGKWFPSSFFACGQTLTKTAKLPRTYNIVSNLLKKYEKGC